MTKLDPLRRREVLKDVRSLIAEAQRQTTAVVNIGLTMLYWRIGKRMAREVLGGERAVYGEQIVVTVSRQLVAEYGRGYTEKNLRRMMQFAEAFPEEEIVVTLSRQPRMKVRKREAQAISRNTSPRGHAQRSRFPGPISQ